MTVGNPIKGPNIGKSMAIVSTTRGPWIGIRGGGVGGGAHHILNSSYSNVQLLELATLQVTMILIGADTGFQKEGGSG